VARYADDERLTDPHVFTVPERTPGEGIGVVEAPRGILIHHYWTDEKGIVERANLIVGTTHNYAPINMSIKKAAQNLLAGGVEASEPLLNTIEMAFRAYDPCFGCATHSLPGKMPLEVKIHDASGSVQQVVERGQSGFKNEVREK